MKDMEEIAALLHVHEKTIQHGGALNHIANAAMKRLQEINAEYDPRKPTTHVRTAFDTEVPPRRVTPPEGPANSAVELKDGTIERVAPVATPAPANLKYHPDGKPIVEPVERVRERDEREDYENVDGPINPVEPTIVDEPETTAPIIERRTL